MDDKATIGRLRRRMARFVRQRDWGKYHRPKNLAMSLAVEAAELMEHFQWLDHDQTDRLLGSARSRRQVAAEMADILSFLLSLANATGIDLAKAFSAKMAANERKYPADRFRGHYRKPRK